MRVAVRGRMDGTYVCSISSHVIEPKKQKTKKQTEKKNVTTKCLRVHVRTRVYLTLFAHLSLCTACPRPAEKYFTDEFLRRIWESVDSAEVNRIGNKRASLEFNCRIMFKMWKLFSQCDRRRVCIILQSISDWEPRVATWKAEKKKKKIAERIVKLVETSVRKIISGRPGTSCIHRYNCALLTYEKKRGKGTVIDRDTAWRIASTSLETVSRT